MNNKVLKYYHGRSVNYFPEINHWSYAQSNSCHSYYWSQRVCRSWWDILGKNTNNSQGRQNSHRNNVQCAHLAFIDKEIESDRHIVSSWNSGQMLDISGLAEVFVQSKIERHKKFQLVSSKVF